MSTCHFNTATFIFVGKSIRAALQRLFFCSHEVRIKLDVSVMSVV